MEDSHIEIYRQRYETFRYFDKLRWQMLQLLVAIGTATALVLRSTQGKVEWWFYLLLGSALTFNAIILFRVNSGLRANSIVLQKNAKEIGDDSIPDVSDKIKSASHWLAVLILILGLGLIIKSLCMASVK